MIQWQDVKLPNDWLLEQETLPAKPIFDELDLTHIQQYLDGTVKISFQNNPPLKINEGRHSFARFESISKRDLEINEFLKKSLEKSSDLKLKSISSDKSQVSSVYYSTKPETSSPFTRTANEDEEDSVSVTPSDFDSPPIENPPVYQNQLRVLTILDELFEVDLVSLYDEFMLAKNRTKRKYFQNNFAQSEKDRVKRKNGWKR